MARAAAERSSVDQPLDPVAHLRGRDDGPMPSTFVSIRFAAGLLGGDALRELLVDAGLASPDGPLPDLISKTALWHLCIAHVGRGNDEGLGCTSRPLPKSTWAIVFAAVNNMPTLRDGLRRMAELVPVVGAGLELGISHDREGARLNFRVADDMSDRDRAEHYLESLALTFHCVLLWITARELRPASIRLSSRLDPEAGSLLSGLADETSRAGTGLAVTYRRSDLALPLAQRRYTSSCAHERITFAELLQRFDATNQDDVDELVETVRRMIDSGLTTQEAVAKRMGLSVPTLRRRLARGGTTFRELLQAGRRSKLKLLLESEQRLDDIAAQLGFQDRRSLWRSAQQWLGTSPGAYRRKVRGTGTAPC